MIEGKGRYHIRHPKGSMVATIHVPAGVARDSNFPFVHTEQVKVEIDTKNKRLIISKLGGEQHE